MATSPESTLQTDWTLCYRELSPEKVEDLQKRGIEPVLPEFGVVCGRCYFHEVGPTSDPDIHYHGCGANIMLSKGGPIHTSPNEVVPQGCYMGVHMEKSQKTLPQRVGRVAGVLWRRARRGL